MKYLYNGVELPALPEWDKEKYPYVYIVAIIERVYMFVEKPYTFQSSSGSSYIANYLKGSSEPIIDFVFADYSQDSQQWGVLYKSTGSEYGDKLSLVRWSNYDVYNPDGTLYRAASYPINVDTGEEIRDYEPVPVSPVPVLNPTDLLSSFFVGQAIRRMRGG